MNKLFLHQTDNAFQCHYSLFHVRNISWHLKYFQTGTTWAVWVTTTAHPSVRVRELSSAAVTPSSSRYQRWERFSSSLIYFLMCNYDLLLWFFDFFLWLYDLLLRFFDSYLWFFDLFPWFFNLFLWFFIRFYDSLIHFFVSNILISLIFQGIPAETSELYLDVNQISSIDTERLYHLKSLTRL